ncbi:MAG: hypothetical protein ACOYD6_05745 [Limnochordia bacterium]|jgi:transcriptional pleiotropic repressor
METLLKQTRQLAKMAGRQSVSGNIDTLTAELTTLLGDVNVYVFGAKGEVLTSARPDGEKCPVVQKGEELTELGHRLAQIAETQTFNTDGPNCPFSALGQTCSYLPQEGVYVPLWVDEQRLGTLAVLASEPFSEGQLILVEMAALVLGLNLISEVRRKQLQQSRERFMAELAMENLSYTELIAVNAIMEELPEREGIVVASRIADNAGITRSIFASALRKLESANIIHTRSLGMKGTYIQILNPAILDLLENGQNNQPRYA